MPYPFAMNSRLLLPLWLLITFVLTACGGGGDTTTGGAGAPLLTNKCEIQNMSISSGNIATLNKSSDQLSTNLILRLQQPLMVDITTNFESSAADDWIEGYPYQQSLQAGDHMITLTYDLQSPQKKTGDRYTKLSVTARLPNDEACVANMPVSILLEP